MENAAGLILLSLRFGLAIILFLFLFWAIRIIWKDFIKTAQSESLQSIPPITLSVEMDEPAPQTFTIPEIRLGRGPACDLQIADDTVSSIHARLFYGNNQWWIEDSGSSNGTFLNDELITTAAVLTKGDQLRFGKIKIDIEFPQQSLINRP